MVQDSDPYSTPSWLAKIALSDAATIVFVFAPPVRMNTSGIVELVLGIPCFVSVDQVSACARLDWERTLNIRAKLC